MDIQVSKEGDREDPAMFYAMYRMYSSMENDLDKTIQVGNHVGVRIWVYLR